MCARLGPSLWLSKWSLIVFIHSSFGEYFCSLFGRGVFLPIKSNQSWLQKRKMLKKKSGTLLGFVFVLQRVDGRVRRPAAQLVEKCPQAVMRKRGKVLLQIEEVVIKPMFLQVVRELIERRVIPSRYVAVDILLLRTFVRRYGAGGVAAASFPARSPHWSRHFSFNLLRHICHLIFVRRF